MPFNHLTATNASLNVADKVRPIDLLFFHVDTANQAYCKNKK